VTIAAHDGGTTPPALGIDGSLSQCISSSNKGSRDFLTSSSCPPSLQFLQRGGGLISRESLLNVYDLQLADQNSTKLGHYL
jgi:hypothetical protein